MTLDQLNVACNRMLKCEDYTSIQMIRFSGFMPEQASTLISGQVYGVSHSGQWCYSNIVLTKEYLLLSDISLLSIVQNKLDLAVQQILKLTDDPFDIWVRKVRREEGIKD